jgi:hypothetical protein
MNNRVGLAISALLLLPWAAQAEVIYGITVPGPTAGNLVSFDSTNLTAVTTIAALSGVVPGHTLRAIDFRPSNGQLYALSSSASAAQLYTVNLATAALTPVGVGLTLTGNTSIRVSMDFNPVVDALRVVTGSAQSYRVNPDTGTLIAQDTSVATVGTGTVPLVSGVAYSNNFVGATQTTLYAYDFLADNVGTIGGLNGVPSPNGGQFNIVGSAGFVTFTAAAGFDISGATGAAYLSVDDFASPGANAEFFSINLGTGAATKLSLNDWAPVLDISVLPVANRGVPAPAPLALAALGLLALRRCRRHAR